MKIVILIILVFKINFISNFNVPKVGHESEVGLLTKNKDFKKGDFQDFLDNFSADSTFQMNHIVFPLKYIAVDIEDNKEIRFIDQEDWKLLHFDYNPDMQNRKIDAYQQLIEVSNDSAKVLIRGTDNGISIYFLFCKIDENWFLTEWYDNSV